jgi:hypothetical protein
MAKDYGAHASVYHNGELQAGQTVVDQIHDDQGQAVEVVYEVLSTQSNDRHTARVSVVDVRDAARNTKS